MDVPFLLGCFFNKELVDWIGLIIRWDVVLVFLLPLDVDVFGINVELCVLLFASSFGLELIDLVSASPRCCWWGVFTRGVFELQLFRALVQGLTMQNDLFERGYKNSYFVFYFSRDWDWIDASSIQMPLTKLNNHF